MPFFGQPDVRKLRSKGDVRGLIRALGYRADAHVRWAAAGALGAAGNAVAVDSLAGALADPDKDVRATAIQALAQIGDIRAVGPVIGALQDPDRDVRIAAAQSLGKLGDVRAIEPLKVVLERDPHDWVRMMAADALEMLGVTGTQGRAQSRRLLEELEAEG